MSMTTLGVDLTLIDGIDVGTALVILAEIGVDVSRFPTEKHFASWLRLCPPQNQSNKTNRSRRDTLRGLKPCSFSELLPSNMPGVPRTLNRISGPPLPNGPPPPVAPPFFSPPPPLNQFLPPGSFSPQNIFFNSRVTASPFLNPP